MGASMVDAGTARRIGAILNRKPASATTLDSGSQGYGLSRWCQSSRTHDAFTLLFECATNAVFSEPGV
jgi:hypothetical protein